MTALLALVLTAWPADLTTGWTAITVTRTEVGQKPRTAKLVLDKGVWKITQPLRGDADVLSLGRLALALKQPVLVTATPKPGKPAFEIELRQGKRVRKVVTSQAALDQPIRVTVDGKAFAVDPVELSTKLPDPDDFAPPGLWVAAKDDAISIEVKGPANYALVGKGEDWKAADGMAATHDLDDVVGVIVGRQVVGHPVASNPETLGLDPPLATAKLCTARECRTFKFGTEGGKYYAVAPDSDPLQLRDGDWKLLVDGPFRTRGTTP